MTRSLSKPGLIAENLNDIPFDLRGLRTIVFQYEPEQMLKLKNSLEEAIIKILDDPNKIDNPVRSFIYNREVERLVKQPAPPGYDVIKDIIAEMSSLRRDFRDHVNEVRHIMKLITMPGENKISAQIRQKIDLNFFEGIWDSSDGGTYCARIVRGELLIPYCYSSDNELDSHLYNCRLIGNTLFARFKWFNTKTAGYMFLKAESTDQLVGGWWLKEEIPEEFSFDFSEIYESLPGVATKITLNRYTITKHFPVWAEHYFAELESSNNSKKLNQV